MRLMVKLMTGAGVLALSSGVAAAAPAVVQNDLNLRAGPGVEYPVVAAMPGGAAVDVMGCEGSWCRVAYNGTVGWASRAYMGLGGAVAAAPGYGYDQGGYASGPVSPGYTYGYYGDTSWRRSSGAYEGERRFGNEQRFGEEGQVRSERRSTERGAARAQGLNDDANARGGSQRASEIQGANPMQNAKDEPAEGNRPRAGESAAEIQGANPMLNAKTSENGNARAEVRGSASQRRGAANVSEGANARATTGASGNEEDHGANFIGPGKNKVDNH